MKLSDFSNLFLGLCLIFCVGLAFSLITRDNTSIPIFIVLQMLSAVAHCYFSIRAEKQQERSSE